MQISKASIYVVQDELSFPDNLNNLLRDDQFQYSQYRAKCKGWGNIPGSENMYLEMNDFYIFLYIEEVKILPKPYLRRKQSERLDSIRTKDPTHDLNKQEIKIIEADVKNELIKVAPSRRKIYPIVYVQNENIIIVEATNSKSEEIIQFFRNTIQNKMLCTHLETKKNISNFLGELVEEVLSQGESVSDEFEYNKPNFTLGNNLTFRGVIDESEAILKKEIVLDDLSALNEGSKRIIKAEIISPRIRFTVNEKFELSSIKYTTQNESPSDETDGQFARFQVGAFECISELAPTITMLIDSCGGICDVTEAEND